MPLTTRVIAVASGKGGVGKSSVTVNLASALAARGFTVGVLDADIWGFSVPRMLGRHRPAGRRRRAARSGPTRSPVGAGRLKVVSMGFLVDDEDMAIMWRGLMLAKALEEFLVKVAWGDMDYLLLDMPPGHGRRPDGARPAPAPQPRCWSSPRRAVAAQKVAVRVADMARRSYLKVLGVIENMSTFTCDHGESYAAVRRGRRPGAGRRAGRRPCSAQVPLEPAVSAANDAGTPARRVAAPDSAAGAAFAADRRPHRRRAAAAGRHEPAAPPACWRRWKRRWARSSFLSKRLRHQAARGCQAPSRAGGPPLGGQLEQVGVHGLARRVP